MTVAVKVQTLPDGGRQVDCWLCLNNFSVHLHVRPEDLRSLLRAHDAKDGGS